MVVTANKKVPDMVHAYFLWLCDLVEGTRKVKRKEFLKMLHEIPFVGKIPNDENREADGKQLRDIFFNGSYDKAVATRECSMLEMLIGLAMRMEYEVSDPSVGDRSSKWFWMFVRNLGLDGYTDSDPDMNVKRDYNLLLLEKFVNRQYDPSGHGGLFPLRKTKKDQRKVEIWYQMAEYLSENFGI